MEIGQTDKTRLVTAESEQEMAVAPSTDDTKICMFSAHRYEH